jgi:protein-L-isoaspartate(D-aspartate) O-methyltransferase
MGHHFDELRQTMVDSQIRTTDVTNLRLSTRFCRFRARLSFPTSASPSPISTTTSRYPVPRPSARRFMMEPSPFARLVQLADVQPGDLVLDIGCGTGYSSALLSLLGNAVIALESDEELADRATDILLENGFDNVAVVTGPLAAGYASEGPYDVIFVGGAVDEVPERCSIS